MGTNTSNRLFNKPTVGGDTGVWGSPLNSNADYLDQILSQAVSINFASASSDVTVSQSNMQYLTLQLTGTPNVSTVKCVLYQNMKGFWFVQNGTPNPVTVVTGNGGTIGCAVPPGGITLVYSDGTNVTPLATGSVIRLYTSGASTTLNAYDQILIVNKGSGSATAVALPAGGGDFTIKDGKGDAATNNITVTVTGGATIDGASSFVIRTNYAAYRFVYNGTQYNVL